jgi:putative DNA primase/helicase
MNDASLDPEGRVFVTEVLPPNGAERRLPNGVAQSDQRHAPPLATLINGASLKAIAITWLWPGWLAAGKVHILGGQPGTGKTTLATRMAATISTGSRWPDGSRTTVGNVVIWSGEDDPADTLVPRLKASGADMRRIFFVGDVREDGENRAFDPATDAEALRAAIARVGGVRLIIVDPIVSAVSGDSHKNSEVRRALQPLANLGATDGAAILGITHFTKGSTGREPIERITGSIAFGALARIVLITTRETEREDGSAGRRILARAKSNIGPDEGGFAYELSQTPLIDDPHIIASVADFGEPVAGTARQILAEAEVQIEDGGAKEEAKAFLLDFLGSGPKTVREIKAAAEAHGIAWRTVERAKASLGVAAEKSDFKTGWAWTLPEDRQDRQPSSDQKTWRSSEDLAVFVKNQALTHGGLRHEDRQASSYWRPSEEGEKSIQDQGLEHGGDQSTVEGRQDRQDDGGIEI